MLHCCSIYNMNVKYLLLFNFSKCSVFPKSLLGTQEIHTCTILSNKNALRTGKVFNKLLGQSVKKKKFYVDTHFGEAPVHPAMTTTKFRGGKENSRRVAVLNKLFMTHITELMATGSAANFISGLNIEISRVSMSPTFTQLNVFWLAQGNERDQLIESLLLEISKSLRHELSQLRVMGEVPRIVFCKDKQLSSINEVEELLKKADYGENYVPLSTAARFKDDNVTMYSFVEDNEEPEQQLPEMSQNTLDLRHDIILKKIQKGMERSKALHRQFPSFVFGESGSETLMPDLMTLKERKEGFDNFLLQRKILREKNIKRERNKMPEVILINNNDDDEDSPLHFDNLSKYDENDYLEEDREETR